MLRNYFIMDISLSGMSRLVSLGNRPLGKTLSKLRKTAAVFSFLFVMFVRQSTSLSIRVVVECCWQRAYCSGLIRPIVAILSLVASIISKTFARMLINEICL